VGRARGVEISSRPLRTCQTRSGGTHAVHPHFSQIFSGDFTVTWVKVDRGLEGNSPRPGGQDVWVRTWVYRQKGRMLHDEFTSAALQVLSRSLVDPRAQRVPEPSVRGCLSTSSDRPTITAAGKSTQMNPGKTMSPVALEQAMSMSKHISAENEPIRGWARNLVRLGDF